MIIRDAHKTGGATLTCILDFSIIIQSSLGISLRGIVCQSPITAYSLSLRLVLAMLG